MSVQTGYPRGSEWRRWDLQVHTPYSALNNGFGTDFDAYAGGLLGRAVVEGIAAIGVTDYFTIEGYTALTQLLADEQRLVGIVGQDVADAAREILLIPNIEFRARDIIRSSGADARVNFHVLFSDELTPEEIDEHFLRELKFTNEAAPDVPEQQFSLTVANLEELGRRLKEDHAPFRSQSDLVVGMQTAVVNHEDVTKVLDRQQSRFKDRFLFVVPADEDLSEIAWDGQGHLVRKVMLQKAHMLFSANAATRDFALGKRHESLAAFEQEFKTRKPCIHGSDAHSADELFAPAEKRYLWIRADPTFHGLRQLLHEPADRVFLGEEPPPLRRIAQRATKYFSEVGFDRTDRALASERWFSGRLPLNHGLIAIIGNKGSGKSALADVLGLLGDARSQSDFSFLNRERFLAPKRGLGGMFQAEVTWHSGESAVRLLDAAVDVSSPERVKYIPQSYLEKICTELRESSTTEFDRELQEVIFSHVDPADRLGRATLPDLLAYRTSEKDAAVKQLLVKLADVNGAIVDLHDRLTPEYRKGLEGELAQRRNELRAHDDAKPAEVKEPSEDPQEQATSALVKQELAEIVLQIQELDKQIGAAERRLDELSRQVVAVERLLARIANLESFIETFYADSVEDAQVLKVDIHELIRLHIDRQPIEAVQAAAIQELETVRTALNPDDETSLARQRRGASDQAEATRLSLDEPNRRHQEFLHQLAAWNQRRGEILGAPDVPDSVVGLEARLADLDLVPERLQQHQAARLQLMHDIFSIKEELLADYRKLYWPVQSFIDTHPVSQETDALEFSASMAVDGLADQLLSMIHQGRKGSFQGDQDGRERVQALVDQSDFDSVEGVDAFVADIERHLTSDLRDDVARPTRLRDQIRQGVSPEGVYDFLFGLRYLRPRFELLWRGQVA